MMADQKASNMALARVKSAPQPLEAKDLKHRPMKRLAAAFDAAERAVFTYERALYAAKYRREQLALAMQEKVNDIVIASRY